MNRKTLKKAREAKGWTRDELGKRSGVHPSTIGMLESGRTKQARGQTQKKVADALGLPYYFRDVQVKSQPKPIVTYSVASQVDKLEKENKNLRVAVKKVTSIYKELVSAIDGVNKWV